MIKAPTRKELRQSVFAFTSGVWALEADLASKSPYFRVPNFIKPFDDCFFSNLSEETDDKALSKFFVTFILGLNMDFKAV